MKIGFRFALAIVSIILVISLAANGYLYNALSENSNLKKQNEEMQNQISSLQSQTDNLQSQTQNLQNQITDLQNQSSRDSNTIDALNSQVANLIQENDNLQKENYNLTTLVQILQNKTSSDVYEPYLVTALGATYTSGYSLESGQAVFRYFLYLQGWVTNTGNGTAYNCALKLIVNTTHGTFTDYYRFNTLAPGENTYIDTHLYYNDVVSWQIFPECTNTP
jgi:TolA-binding protein